MSPSARLDALPEELLAEIAIACDALSALRLSATCQKIRSAVYTGLTFRQVLEASQRYSWQKSSLQLEPVQALAHKKGVKNKHEATNVWARYAVADYKAWELVQTESPLETPEAFLHWLPELCTVKHPFIYQQCWDRPLRDMNQQPLEQVFCQAMAVLASEDEMPQLSKILMTQETGILPNGTEAKDFLWALCAVATALRRSLRTLPRRAPWPSTSAANVPNIPLPTALQLNFASNPDPPQPFSKSKAFVLWFDHWNEAHAFDNPDYFTRGTWCGYYTSLTLQPRGHPIDPPMTNINFRVTPLPQGQAGAVKIEAEGCQDGIGPFDIRGRLGRRQINEHGDTSGEVQMMCRKVYSNIRTSWYWDLRVTPFGLVGFWGGPAFGAGSDETGMRRLGLVWLWKEEWTATAPSCGTAPVVA
ncbi:hypothetical protein B0A50_02914 [Salinomyces thailandicus]|uniref:F-box domain-containing protein n=1 Tax=Salinomyces thailandicus TaxID=706561 RepID=A0A4U0U1B9_9PEZI|nr:hypothetical protein B0A50_02914 [Salinomyces thailandica]